MKETGLVIKDENGKHTIDVVVSVNEMGWAIAMTSVTS